MIIKLSVARDGTRQAFGKLTAIATCMSSMRDTGHEARCWGASRCPPLAKALTTHVLLWFSHLQSGHTGLPGNRTRLVSEDLGPSALSAPNQLDTLGQAAASWPRCPANERRGGVWVPPAPTSCLSESPNLLPGAPPLSLLHWASMPKFNPMV